MKGGVTVVKKKIPLRKCSGCGEMKPKKELIRVVKAPDIKDDQGNVTQKGEVSLDLTGKKPGRGAYLCRSMKCFAAAKKAGRFQKAFSCNIPAEVFKVMEEELSEYE